MTDVSLLFLFLCLLLLATLDWADAECAPASDTCASLEMSESPLLPEGLNRTPAHDDDQPLAGSGTGVESYESSGATVRPFQEPTISVSGQCRSGRSPPGCAVMASIAPTLRPYRRFYLFPPRTTTEHPFRTIQTILSDPFPNGLCMARCRQRLLTSGMDSSVRRE